MVVFSVSKYLDRVSKIPRVVISAQKVLFLTLFKIGSKYFLCTNLIS